MRIRNENRTTKLGWAVCALFLCAALCTAHTLSDEELHMVRLFIAIKERTGERSLYLNPENQNVYQIRRVYDDVRQEPDFDEYKRSITHIQRYTQRDGIITSIEYIFNGDDGLRVLERHEFSVHGSILTERIISYRLRSDTDRLDIVYEYEISDDAVRCISDNWEYSSQTESMGYSLQKTDDGYVLYTPVPQGSVVSYGGVALKWDPRKFITVDGDVMIIDEHDVDEIYTYRNGILIERHAGIGNRTYSYSTVDGAGTYRYVWHDDVGGYEAVVRTSESALERRLDADGYLEYQKIVDTDGGAVEVIVSDSIPLFSELTR